MLKHLFLLLFCLSLVLFWPLPLRCLIEKLNWQERKKSMRTSSLLTLALSASLFALPAQAKDPATGATTYTVYEGYMSPPQQPGEETEAPKAVAKATGLESTA